MCVLASYISLYICKMNIAFISDSRLSKHQLFSLTDNLEFIIFSNVINSKIHKSINSICTDHPQCWELRWFNEMLFLLVPLGGGTVQIEMPFDTLKRKLWIPSICSSLHTFRLLRRFSRPQLIGCLQIPQIDSVIIYLWLFRSLHTVI